MNTYQCTNGDRVTKAVIDRNVRKAKELKIAQFTMLNGYAVCEDCKRNDCTPIDCSHDISVDQCQKIGQSEKAWSIDNITLRGRKCHRKHDKL